MKQKIVIKVQMDCDKCRSKALKVASVAKGVSSVALEGDDKDQVVVIGEGVDPFCLVKALRKKFHRRANILSVEKVKDKDKDKDKDEKEIIKSLLLPWNYSHYYPYTPCPPNVACSEDQYCIVM